jgi:P-loop Domain of unknown function (DUF2791)
MSLKDKLADIISSGADMKLASRFGVLENPFPAANQTTDNPHLRQPSDDEVEARIATFVRDSRSQVVVVVGTQGTGKTNVLNFYESELKLLSGSMGGYYIVRYLADPEASFDSTLRKVIQELGVSHLERLGERLAKDGAAIEDVRSHEFKVALQSLAKAAGDHAVASVFNEWLVGLRLLKAHKEVLGVNFRLDTVESRTAAVRDLIQVSSKVGLLNGIFLLLDELEKQGGVLSATLIVRYLSSMRAIIDALPRHLFMMLAVTPDALRRYSQALPAFRSRLENQITLPVLTNAKQAIELGDFYVAEARRKAQAHGAAKRSRPEELVTHDQMREIFVELLDRAKKRSDEGVRHREFLHALHDRAESAIQAP